MSMVNTTHWKDLRNPELNQVFETIVSNDGQTRVPLKGKRSYYFHVKKITNDVVHKEIKILDKNVNSDRELKLLYKDIDYFYVRVDYRFKNTNDNVVEQSLFILGYKLDDSVYYIINKNSDAKKFLRLLLTIEQNGVLEKSEEEKISNAMFYWIIRKVFLNNKRLDIDDDFNITLDKVIGIKGMSGKKTIPKPKKNTLAVQGNSIDDLKSTLFFLLDIDSFKEVQIELSFDGHSKVVLSLHEDGRVGTDVLKYKGIYRAKPGFEKEALILLLLYLEIIPIIRNFFNLYEKRQDFSDMDDFINTFISKARKSLEELAEDHKISYEK